jgi:hypothetical protein
MDESDSRKRKGHPMPDTPNPAHPEERPSGRVSEAQLARRANDHPEPATPAHPEPVEEPLTPLTDFTPVTRKCARHDGWTPARQKAFIEALADYGSVRDACQVVGLATTGAYQLRRQPGAEEFAAAWEAALACAVKRLEDTLMDRALNGVEVPVYSYGKLLGTRTQHNDRLGMFFLRNRAPHRFAVGGGPKALNAIGQMELERRRKQWREEWEEERRQQDEEEDKEVTAGLIDTFEQMHRRWYAGLSRAARAAYRTFRRIERDDRARSYFPGDDERAEAEAEYDAGATAQDERAKINMLIEADGYGVDEVLASDEALAEEAELASEVEAEAESASPEPPPTLPPPTEPKPDEPDDPSGPRAKAEAEAEAEAEANATVDLKADSPEPRPAPPELPALPPPTAAAEAAAKAKRRAKAKRKAKAKARRQGRTSGG